MTNRLPAFIILLFISILGIGCHKDDDGNLLVNIEEEFDIYILETLQPGTNKLHFLIRSKEPLECSNYELNHSQSIGEDRFIISIDDLSLEGACNEEESIAMTNASLGYVPEGTYDMELNLNLNTIINKGKLTVRDDSYKLQMSTTHGFSLFNTNLLALPDGYFWGFIHAQEPSAAALIDVFFSDLENYSEASELADGNYGYFRITESQAKLRAATMDQDIPTEARSFIYKVKGDKAALLSFVEDFQNAYAGLVELVLFTSEGE